MVQQRLTKSQRHFFIDTTQLFLYWLVDLLYLCNWILQIQYVIIIIVGDCFKFTALVQNIHVCAPRLLSVTFAFVAVCNQTINREAAWSTQSRSFKQNWRKNVKRILEQQFEIIWGTRGLHFWIFKPTTTHTISSYSVLLNPNIPTRFQL